MKLGPAFDRRWIVLGLLVGLLVGLAVVLAARRPPAPPPPRDAEQDGAVFQNLDAPAAARIRQRLEADATLKPLLAACPADVWRRRGDLARSPPVDIATCAKTPDTCLADCLEFASGHACFRLARIMQKSDGAHPLAGETLYQLACAAGQSGGCVNRAAGLRNTRYAGDPYPKAPDAAREACQFASFKLGCDAGDSWGCAMRGQAYALGEGVAADKAAARRDYARACAKDDKFAACVFAKGGLAELDRPAVKDSSKD